MTWTPVSLNQASAGGVRPSPRYAHSGAVIDDKIIYIGGQLTSKVRFNDIFNYNTSNGRFTQAKVNGNPPNISKHTAVTIKGIIYVFGGYDGLANRFELFRYDPAEQTWTSPVTHGDRPAPRSNHCSAVIDNRMYIFGGLQRVENDLVDSNDLHYMDVDTMTWHTPQVTGDIPLPRCGHKMTTIDGKLYLFGGGNGDGWTRKFNDVHVFDPISNAWTEMKTTGVAADSTTFASVWSFGRFLFVFGGGKFTDTSTVTNEVFTLDTVTCHWTKQSVQGTPPTARDDCTTNILGDTIYLMHGFNSGPIDQFWSIQMSPDFYRAVKGEMPPPKMIKESSSPLLSFSPSIRGLSKFLSPFLQRRDNKC